MSKKIIIFTYYWPPSGGSGVQRWLYFSFYLKKLNWDPIIITVDYNKASYSLIDESLNNISKDLRVIRTKTSDPLRAYSKFKTGNTKDGIPQSQIDNSSLINQFFSFIRGNFFIPDARIGWNRHAIKVSKSIIEKENIKYLITTGPPHSSHLIGLELVKKYKLKWLADFRDPWSNIFYNKYFYRLPYFQKKDEKYEKKVLEKASCILTTVGEDFHKLLKSKISTKQTFFSIINGYDKGLVESIIPKKESFFHIVYTGVLTKNQSYDSVIFAIKKLSKTYPKTPIKLTISGKVEKSIIQNITNKISLIEVQYLGYLSHREAVILMKSANVLLNFIFNDADKFMISGKILEYMASEIPIISIGSKENPISKLFSKSELMKVFKADDLDGIYLFLDKLIKSWQRGIPLFNRVEKMSKYSREELSKKLDSILRDL